MIGARTITEAVTERGAPRNVIDAAERIDKYIDAKLSPPADLVQYVQRWVGNNQGQDRYGK